MTNCNPIQTPLPTKLPTDPSLLLPFAQPALFRQLVGSLQYLSSIRPDIAFAVNKLCQQMHSPLILHFQLAKRVLRYLKGTLHYALFISKTDLVLTAFADSDWAGDTVVRKSTSGYCTFLGKALIALTVKKQSTVARSSTESEYRSLAAAAADLIWIRRLCADFDITLPPSSIFCDSVSALSIAQHPIFHARTKHIEIDHHFLRDSIQAKHITVHHVASEDQIADLLTKPLHYSKFNILRTKLMVVPPINLRDGEKHSVYSTTSEHEPRSSFYSTAASPAVTAAVVP
ncbi:putative mitochondrial protein [Dendrobium catenatum]|uniref:Putative mitochondrial protein n=1 Tax=Dendrobium catenatum TaxID=906689 RepID=A0A2I0W6K0_9ASPA|nr:putative mitochondrial protein [Dendrobium catenatum]